MKQEYKNEQHERAMKAPITKVRQEYTDYWKTHKPTSVGLSKVGNFGCWYILYNNGTSKKISWFWNIVPSRYRMKLLLDKSSRF
jgi:hypothetical protein